MLRIILLITSFVFISISFGEKVQSGQCTNTDPKDLCRMKEVRIVPCKEARSNKSCNLKRGKVANIQIDFRTLEFIESFKALPFWASINDLALMGVNDNGCLSTTCPIQSNTNQLFNFNLNISTSFPRGKFPLKFKFWLLDDDKKGCCITFDIKLV